MAENRFSTCIKFDLRSLNNLFTASKKRSGNSFTLIATVFLWVISKVRLSVYICNSDGGVIQHDQVQDVWQLGICTRCLTRCDMNLSRLATWTALVRQGYRDESFIKWKEMWPSTNWQPVLLRYVVGMTSLMRSFAKTTTKIVVIQKGG